MRRAVACSVLATMLMAGLFPPSGDSGIGVSGGTRAGDLYDELLLSGPASDWLAYAYTNKALSFLWQSTTGRSMSEFSGFNARKFRVLDGWEVWNGSTRLMSPAESYAFQPHRFVRSGQGIEEEVFVPEGLDGFGLEYTAVGVPQFRVSFLLEADYRDAWWFANNTLVLKTNNTGRRPVAYVAITGDRAMGHVGSTRLVQRRYYFDEYRVGNTTWVLKWLWQAGFLDIGTLNYGDRLRLAVGVGASEASAAGVARTILAEKTVRLAAKEERLRTLVNSKGLRSSDPLLERAFNFALTAMDNLRVNETFGPAIWAGLPWFNNAWGRDTFISLRGGLISTGDFEEAKKIIRSFAAFQRDSDGRIPNFVPTTGTPPYNSADATLWLLVDLYDLFERMDDRAFNEEMFPVVAKSLDRTWAAYGDPGDGLLWSGDLETWMDTSADPRAGKPIEIQFLWMRALELGMRLALQVGNASAESEWLRIRSLASGSIPRLWNNSLGYFADYISPTGSPVLRIRPNALIPITLGGRTYVDKARWDRAADVALRKGLITPNGVRSIEPSDPLYRGNDTSTWDSPAYHNGDIWPWLSGPAAEVLAWTGHYDWVDRLIRTMAGDVLSRDNLGTLPEILDGDDGEPKGAWTQAWSIAEFLRLFYQVVLGVRVEAGAITFSPAPLPGSVSFSLPVRIRNETLVVNYTVSPEHQRLEVVGSPPMDTSVYLLPRPGARAYAATVVEDGAVRRRNGTGSLTDLGTVRFTRSLVVDVTYRIQPSVALLSPRGGESFAAGEAVRVEWRPDADLAGDFVTVELSLDPSRRDWSVLANVTAESSFAWRAPDIDTSHAVVRVTLHTAHGETAVAESGEFSISRPWPLYVGAAAGVGLGLLAVAWAWRRRRRGRFR